MAKEPILSAKDVEIQFSLRGRMLKAIRRCSLDLYDGETLAIVGESGSGKSVFTKSFLGMLDANGSIVGGSIMYEGKDISKYKSEKEWMTIRGKKISMVMQDPMTSLNPLKKVGKQIQEAIELNQGVKGEKAKEMAIEMLRKVGIPMPEQRYNQYPHEFSGGMLQRALIAMALVCNPKLLIADEPTTALDVTIQAQVLELMKDLQKDFDTSILFITHDLGVVARMCDRVAVMYLGKIVESADSTEIYANPQHPYTRGLIGSVHKIGSKKEERLFSIEGTVPLAMNLPKACGFYDRCDARIEGLCNKAEPELVEVAPGHKIACFNCPHEACKEQRARVEAMLREEEAKHE